MKRREFVISAAAAATAVAPVRRHLVQGPGVRVDRGRLQVLLDETARALGIVGAQVAVFDGQQIHEVATGFANRERQLAVTADTLFQIGSTTKVFNAALILTLVDEGKLDLDRPVKTWIPDFRLADSAATGRVTLRQLLSMSAGLDNGPYQDYGRGDDALIRYVASLAEIPQIFEPGTAFGYANAGSNVAGLAAQLAGGKNWETLLAEKILGPLGLRHAANFAEDLLYHPVALGYRLRPDSTEPALIRGWSLPRSMAPAGGTLSTSAGDLVRLGRMFLSGGKGPDGKQVVSAAGIRTMHTPQVILPNRVTAQKWCTGPYWKQWGGETIYGHSGTNRSGSSMLLWVPSKNVAIATIANVPNQGYPLADRVFDTVFPEMFGIAKPKAPTPATVTPVKVDLPRYLGRFEAYGSRLEFADEGGRLLARVFSGAGDGGPPNMTSEMIPLGDDRFLPADPAMGGNRGWDVAFWGRDGAGRATHFLNGVFAMRRTGAP
ncbi:MAG: serine hydrolase domain-containing protein [Gemmatimonadales bacterium]